MRRLLLALVVAVTAAACAELPEPDLGLVPATSTTLEPESGEATSDEPAPAVAAESTVGVFSPPRPEGYVPTLLVAADTGMLVVSESGQPQPLGPPLDELVVERLADDYFGGLVVEGIDGAIRWFSQDRAAGETIGLPGDRLLDVGFVDETLAANVFVSVGESQIERISLAGSDRVVFTNLESGQTIIDMSAGEGIYVAAVADDACGALLFFDSTGQQVDVGGPVGQGCEVAGRPVFGTVALGPGGTAVAYTEIRYRSDGVQAATRLSVLELGTNVELFSAQVGGGGDRVTSLDFDGERLAFVRTGTAGQEAEVIEIAAESAQVIELDEASTPSAVAFARQQLLVGS